MSSDLNIVEGGWRGYEEMMEEAFAKARKTYGKDFYLKPGQFRLKNYKNEAYLEWSPGYDSSGMG